MEQYPRRFYCALAPAAREKQGPVEDRAGLIWLNHIESKRTAGSMIATVTQGQGRAVIAEVPENLD